MECSFALANATSIIAKLEVSAMHPQSPIFVDIVCSKRDVVDKRYKLVHRWEMRKKDRRTGSGWTGGKKKREINNRDKVRGLICREARGWMLRGRCIM
jgi:hypothetical protein